MPNTRLTCSKKLQSMSSNTLSSLSSTFLSKMQDLSRKDKIFKGPNYSINRSELVSWQDKAEIKSILFCETQNKKHGRLSEFLIFHMVSSYRLQFSTGLLRCSKLLRCLFKHFSYVPSKTNCQFLPTEFLRRKHENFIGFDTSKI